MMPPKVSIILPIYNTENYLRECLDSVVAQTLREIEIICVDDGSTDNSPAILDEYARQAPRIHVIHQPNTGAGAARNRGLAETSGEYLAFLDGDDVFFPEMLERAYDRAYQFQADVVIFQYKWRYEENGLINESKSFGCRTELLPEADVFSRKILPRTIFTLTNEAAWNKLFRREFVLKEKLQFQTIHNSNDCFL